ncbi:hypothetical protein EDD80_11835 [Anseongella ginsenosidimutans]|uniref:Uncharacterized protein n=1 Tax=Anseongella ginsenosidimutans TaxID=496056 RepID=A0A4V2UT89_9SPHI|nr:hypothetical protein EDD80_11835 [Anseongella ginsenosidimutans]
MKSNKCNRDCLKGTKSVIIPELKRINKHISYDTQIGNI